MDEPVAPALHAPRPPPASPGPDRIWLCAGQGHCLSDGHPDISLGEHQRIDKAVSVTIASDRVGDPFHPAEEFSFDAKCLDQGPDGLAPDHRGGAVVSFRSYCGGG